MGDFNAKEGREESRHKVSGKYSLHKHNNENGAFLVQFAIRKKFLHQGYSISTKDGPHGHLENP
jgi:hypothetical protein